MSAPDRPQDPGRRTPGYGDPVPPPDLGPGADTDTDTDTDPDVDAGNAAGARTAPNPRTGDADEGATRPPTAGDQGSASNQEADQGRGRRDDPGHRQSPARPPGTPHPDEGRLSAGTGRHANQD